MAGSRATTKRRKNASRARKTPARKPARKPPTVAERLALPKVPQFEQSQLEMIGLGLVAAAVFFGFVFYLDWDGGEVGYGLAEAFRWLFGGVAYLTPVALFAFGALLVLRPLLPTVRPFKTGAICLLTALMLGLAAGTFGLGPNNPPRHGAFAQPAFFTTHGGVVGES